MAVVAHLDADAFFVAVARRNNPGLSHQPVAVGERVVASASYEARNMGVHAAMPVSVARRLCPGLVVVGVTREQVDTASAEMFAMFTQAYPDAAFEPVSVDEAYLDLSEQYTTPEEAVSGLEQLRSELARSLGLICSVGVSGTKLVAKVASADAKPDGILAVGIGDQQAYLAPKPVNKLPGVGPASTERLASIGVTFIRDVTRADPELLEATLGASATQRLREQAAGQDRSHVEPPGPPQSISAQTALGAAVRSVERVADTLDELTVSLMGRLAADGRLPYGVTVTLRWSDYRTVTSRSVPLVKPTNDLVTLVGSARAATVGFAPRITTEGVTLLGVTFTALGGPGVRQPHLFNADALVNYTGAAAPLELDERAQRRLISRHRWTPGTRVHHPVFGDGNVIGYTSGYITVAFTDKERELDAALAPLSGAD